MYINGPETRKTPPEFQARLTRMFGTNEFGDPHFKIVWAQSEFIRMGNVWRDRHGTERVGYRDRYLAHGQPCWSILRWLSPMKYGSPYTYYANTYLPNQARRTGLVMKDGHLDEEILEFESYEGMYCTGEYPWRGRYEVMYQLISKEFVDNKLVITHFPLSHYLIDTLIPLILMVQRLRPEELAAAKAHAKHEEEKKRTEEIAERMHENMPRWINPVSYSMQGCRTSLLDRKMNAIQKVWDRMSRGGRKPVFDRGLAQGDRPSLVKN